jgi:hypothetical protein
VSGIVPFGYRLVADGRTLEADGPEAATLATIQRMGGDGQSLRAIADALNAAGTPTRARTPWRFEYVRNLLRGAAWRDTTGRLYPSAH